LLAATYGDANAAHPTGRDTLLFADLRSPPTTAHSSVSGAVARRYELTRPNAAKCSPSAGSGDRDALII